MEAFDLELISMKNFVVTLVIFSLGISFLILTDMVAGNSLEESASIIYESFSVQAFPESVVLVGLLLIPLLMQAVSFIKRWITMKKS